MNTIGRGRAALLLLVIQLGLVLSIAGKYWYERKTCQRVWTRATVFDPNQPLRGRYLAMQMLLNGCALPRDEAHVNPAARYPVGPLGARAPEARVSWTWDVSLQAVQGQIVPRTEDNPKSPEDVDRLMLWWNMPCDRAILQSQVEYFIPDRAKGPFPLKREQELWVEVTLPPSGPPRPIQAAVSGADGFHPLHFE